MPDSLRERFLAGMSAAACTVNIVTTNGAAGRFGVTVSAMASVSADGERPTLLACINERSAAADGILRNGVFCLNILRAEQSHISDSFGGRPDPQFADKFDCAVWADNPSGSPRIADSLVAFDCRLLSGEKVGTHYVFIGAVDHVFTSGYGQPLIYSNRSYGVPRPLVRT
jgi:flavin reductase (DIM6/NTAB) family NADH-FMN oxidoreductase RutF